MRTTHRFRKSQTTKKQGFKEAGSAARRQKGGNRRKESDRRQENSQAFLTNRVICEPFFHIETRKRVLPNTHPVRKKHDRKVEIAQLLSTFFFFNSGEWVKTKGKLPHFPV